MPSVVSTSILFW